MPKIKLLLLILICLLVFTTSCSSKSSGTIEVFDYTSSNNLYVDKFKSDLKESLLYKEEYENAEIVNYANEQIVNLYKVGLFGLAADDYYLFSWFDGQVTLIDSFKYPFDGRTLEFTNFAVADLNSDRYNEFYFTYCYSLNDGKSISFASVYCLDFNTGKIVESMTNYESYLFFKSENDRLFVVESSTSVLGDDYKLFFEVTPNNKRFEILNKEFVVNADTFTANVYIENDFVDFPVYLDEFSQLEFTVRVEMTYLGETFSYVSGNGYLEGAVAEVKSEGYKICVEPIAADDVVTSFTVYNNQVIDRTYVLYDSIHEPIKIGTYDVTIIYRNDSVIVEDVIKFY